MTPPFAVPKPALTIVFSPVNQAKYFSEGFINVANDSTVALKDPSDESKSTKPPEKEWVARILEIRASDEHHVYARIYWMYSPDEIPAGARDANNNAVSGRQPYHGQNELIASNHSKTVLGDILYQQLIFVS